MWVKGEDRTTVATKIKSLGGSHRREREGNKDSELVRTYKPHVRLRRLECKSLHRDLCSRAEDSGKFLHGTCLQNCIMRWVQMPK